MLDWTADGITGSPQAAVKCHVIYEKVIALLMSLFSCSVQCTVVEVEVEWTVPRFAFALLCFRSNPRCWEPRAKWPTSNAPLHQTFALCMRHAPNSSISLAPLTGTTSPGYISKIQAPFGPKNHFTQPTIF
jgi:hypothetical protein